MRNPHNRSVLGAMFPMLFASAAVLLSSCSGELTVQREARQVGESGPATSYSIVFVIHGDGDYLYHDTRGDEYEADVEAVAAAKRVAQLNTRAEVFIFHQRPREHFLLFFPVRDGEFYYYRNGQLVANESYWRNHEQSRFDAEVGLYRRFREYNQRKMVRMFFYCGHEIPEFGGKGYDASYPNRTFTVLDLADGLQGFTRYSARFDLMVLATCFGGTPYTIGALGPFARCIIASPENLHLSYFDLHSLDWLDLRMQGGDVPGFAKRFARKAFDRLTRDVQTAVSVSVYDVDEVQTFIQSVHGVYDRALATLGREPESSVATIGHCDCADLPSYLLPTMNIGVDIFYRPARFGRSKNNQNHSGWECWKETGLQAMTLQSIEPALK